MSDIFPAAGEDDFQFTYGFRKTPNHPVSELRQHKAGNVQVASRPRSRTRYDDDEDFRKWVKVDQVKYQVSVLYI